MQEDRLLNWVQSGPLEIMHTSKVSYLRSQHEHQRQMRKALIGNFISAEGSGSSVKTQQLKTIPSISLK